MSAAALIVAASVSPAGAAHCLDYSEGRQILQARMQSASPKLRQQALAVYSQYFKAAKVNNKAKLITLYSRADGSARRIQQSINKNNSFGEFHRVQTVSTLEVTPRWGDYLFLFNRYYLEGNQEGVMIDAVHCPGETNCAMSLVQNHGGEERDLSASFLAALSWQLQGDAKWTTTCPPPQRAADIEVWPTTSHSGRHPLEFFVRPLALRPVKLKSELTKPGSVGAACLQGFLEAEAEIGDEVEYRKRLEAMLASCATNTEPGSMIPTVALSQPPRQLMQTPRSLLATASGAGSIHSLARLDWSPWQLHLVQLKPADQEQQLLVAPIVERNGRPRFDWSFFSTVAGEFLASTAFAGLVRSAMPPAKSAQQP